MNHRPAYHFLPPGGWMNDPNGLIQFNGEYHLFYQYNPKWPEGASVIWGHAVAKDLVHWRHLAPAMLADKPYDKGGVWSGCAVNNDGAPVLLYTGVMPEVQCVAFGSSDMLTFTKHEQNPVIPAPPEGLEVTGFRDPYVWKSGDIWYMVVGSGLKDVGGAILLYKSADLLKWEYLGTPLVGDKAETGEMWECPNFICLGDKWALFVAVFPRSLYFVGDFDGSKFTPTYRGETDPGGSFYAPQIFRDDSGRHIMFGWLWERPNFEAKAAEKWAGVQSLPRVISLNSRGGLDFAPAKEVEGLRGAHTRHDNLPAGGLLDGVRGAALEIIAELEPSDVGACGVKVCCSPDGREETIISYDFEAQTLTIDGSRSSVAEAANKEVRSAPVPSADGCVTLRVFVDASVVEVFANGTCVTCRVYPDGPESVGVGTYFRGECRVRSLDVWQMGPMAV